MGRSSRDKGRRGELEIARVMSAWWMGDPSLLEAKAVDLPIRRTPLSGGWASGKGVGGDLVPVSKAAEDFNMLSVEVKNQECWSFDGILKDEKWPIYGWWKQCCEAATKANAVPLLLFTKNQHPFYFCMAYKHWKMLIQVTGHPPVVSWGGCKYGLLDAFVSTFTRADFKKVFGERYGA